MLRSGRRARHGRKGKGLVLVAVACKRRGCCFLEGGAMQERTDPQETDRARYFNTCWEHGATSQRGELISNRLGDFMPHPYTTLDARCKMQDARCNNNMLDARCKMHVARRRRLSPRGAEWLSHPRDPPSCALCTSKLHCAETYLQYPVSCGMAIEALRNRAFSVLVVKDYLRLRVTSGRWGVKSTDSWLPPGTS